MPSATGLRRIRGAVRPASATLFAVFDEFWEGLNSEVDQTKNVIVIASKAARYTFRRVFRLKPKQPAGLLKSDDPA